MIVAAWLGIALAAPPPDPLAPDLQGLGMVVTTVADGLARDGRWTAVDVTLVNVGPDTEATVEVDLSDATRATPLTVAYKHRFELPSGTKRRVFLPMLVPPGTGTVEVSMVADDQRRTSRTLPLRRIGDEAVGIGVIGESTGGIQTIATAWSGPVPGRIVRAASTDRDVRVGQLDAATLPTTPVAYDALDWVVWLGADPTRVDDAAERALLDWVADGGHLLVTGADAWARIAGSPLGDALPVTYRGSALLDDVGAFSAPLGGVTTWPGPIPVAEADVRAGPGRDAWVLAGDGARPLWVIGTYGLGTITVVPLDPTLTTVGGAIPRTAMWRRLLWLPEDESSAANAWFGTSDLGVYREPSAFTSQLAAVDAWRDEPPRLSRRLAAALHLAAASRAVGETDLIDATSQPDLDQLSAWLATMPGVAPIPLSWLLLFASTYLLVIGPIDGLVLRLLRRETWTWVTFPIWIAVFSAGALTVTSVTKGSESRAMVVDFVDALPGTDRWRYDTYLGLFAAARLEAGWRSTDERGAVAPMERDARALWDVAVTDGEMRWRAETWSLGLAHDRGFLPAKGAVTVRSEGNGWKVENATPYDAFVVVVAGDYQWPVGTMRPGQAKAIVPSSIVEERDTTGVASPIDLATATDDEVGPAMAAWYQRTDTARGAIDVTWHRPVVVAVTREEIAPLALTGVRPSVHRVAVLRFPIDPQVVAPAMAESGPIALGSNELIVAGAKVEIRGIGMTDGHYAQRKSFIGKSCFTAWDMYPMEKRWYSGNLTCDGTSEYFDRVQLLTLERPIPWPLGITFNTGDPVRIVAVGPGDAEFTNEAKWQAATCKADTLYASAPLGWASGGVECDGNTVYFSQVYVEPKVLPATWSKPVPVGAKLRLDEILFDDPAMGSPAAPIGATCTVVVARPGPEGTYAGRFACNSVVDLVHARMTPLPEPTP